MVSPTLVAAPLCILPAMAVLWLLGWRFEGYFDEKRLFFSLVIGFFAGLVVAFFELALFAFHDPSILLASGGPFLLAVGYPLLESLAKLVVLGSKGFRARKDTPFYGASLGLGFGALLWLQYLARHLIQLGVVGDGPLTTRLAGALIAASLALGAILASAATGAWIGKAVTDGKRWRGLGLAVLALAPIATLLGVWTVLVENGAGASQLAMTGLASTLYGGVLMVYAIRTLDNIVPPEIRDLVRRDRRRMARSAE